MKKLYPITMKCTMSVHQGDRVEDVVEAESPKEALAIGHSKGVKIWECDYSDVVVHVKLPVGEEVKR